jgi:uncharacterized protein
VRIPIYIAVGILAVGLLIGLRIAAKSFLGERSDYVRTPSTAISRNPERAGIPGLIEVSFPSADAVRLAAWYVPSRNRAALVLVHGTSADRSSLLTEARFLAEAGFGVLALDLPGQGQSEGRTRWGVPERHAIVAAVDWLSARDDVDSQRIGGFGLSMGAYVLTQAAVLDRRLRSVTLVSTPNDVVEQNWLGSDQWGLLTQIPCYLALRMYGQSLDMLPKDVIGAIAPRAVFVVAGDLDNLVPKFMAQQLYASAGDPKALWIVPGAGHSDFTRIAPREYSTRLTDFFLRTLLG